MLMMFSIDLVYYETYHLHFKLFLTICMHEFGWLSEIGVTFQICFRKRGFPQKRRDSNPKEAMVVGRMLSCCFSLSQPVQPSFRSFIQERFLILILRFLISSMVLGLHDQLLIFSQLYLIELPGFLTGLGLLELWHLIYPRLLAGFGMLFFFTNLSLTGFQVRFLALFLLSQ